MDLDGLESSARKTVQEILGYLNFSSGASDPRFLANVNRLFGLVGGRESDVPGSRDDEAAGEPTWRALGRLLRDSLKRLCGSSEAFREVGQARAVLRLVFDDVLTGYRRFHRDLLFHQTDELLFGPLFLGRVCEAVLSQGGPWHESERITGRAIDRLNDFIGHRPVATLRTERKLQPYAHEWVRPIPLWIRSVGVAVGRYHELIEALLGILRATERELLDQAWFDPELLDELALDPRAYDFDHPVNRRPSYQFGQWDPHHIDNRGHYRRFVLQQITLEAIASRLDDCGQLPREEVLFEAAAVLAGTILMGSGMSGSGPDSHDSSTTLAGLLAKIAAYRDTFYEQLLARLPRAHRERLRAEADKLRQPFGGARQHLNQELARRRADQLQHLHLGRLFARMGYDKAALRQARMVSAASSRMSCQIYCCLGAAGLQIDRGRLEAATALMPKIEDLLHRAIECGALVDPWNILGFGGQFSLFPAVENSVHDHRADELIGIMGDIFGLYTRMQKEAAAGGNTDLHKGVSERLAALARWWDRFATVEVSSVEGISGTQAWESAVQVATSLGAWHEAGTAAGDIAFWREHVAGFRSPKAYALVVEALLEQRDPVASMALLMQWLSQSEQIPLVEGDYSFHKLALGWMEALWQEAGPAGERTDSGAESDRRWPMARKFLDHLEASAGELWEVPKLELLGQPSDDGSRRLAEDADDPSENPFRAAYENMTYRDTTDDGFDSEMLEGGEKHTDFELSLEVKRINRHLVFLRTLGRLWKLAAVASANSPGAEHSDRNEVLAGWFAQADSNRKQLLELLAVVHRYSIGSPGANPDQLLEYDRRQEMKETLLERVIDTCVQTADAGRLILATSRHDESLAEWGDWEAAAQPVLRAVYSGKVEAVRARWDDLLAALAREPLLYIPVSRGGSPQRILASRSLQQTVHRLLAYLPQLGLLRETCQLIETVHQMEGDHPVGSGAITRFEEMFETGYRAIVRCLAAAYADEPGAEAGSPSPAGPSDEELIDCLQEITEPLFRRWLAHNRIILLSVLEKVADSDDWNSLKQFIQRYGHDIFTQKFMNLGNLRAILHQGVDTYLGSLEEEPDADERFRLLADLDGPLPRDQAVRWLRLALEAVVEDYAAYIDYNSTTTQSDRGELLYTLLDFLRLLAKYQRMASNLYPLVLAHEVLVRSARTTAAELWQEEITWRTNEIADDLLMQFEHLCREYGMRLRSVAEQLNQRFVQPLLIDRICALIRPAIDELRSGRPTTSFDLLQARIDRLAQQHTGAGFDVPPWIESLQDELQRIQTRPSSDEEALDCNPPIRQKRLSLDQLRRQVKRRKRRKRR